MLTIDDLPELPPEERTTERSALTGLPASLSPKQRTDLETLRSRGRCPPQYDPTSGAYRVHTCDAHLIDPTVKTISPGTDPRTPNAYMLPRGDGSWTLYRYGGVAEHESWTHRDGRTWIVLNPHLEHDLDFSGDYRPATGPTVTSPYTPVSIGQLAIMHPRKSDPVIDGLIRRGETANIIAAPKVGKSWLAYYFALCIAIGRMLFGWATYSGRVLIIDNELHPAVIADRIQRVAAAAGIPPEDYADRIDVISLRGRLLDLSGLERHIIDRLDAGAYSAIICDAWYRFSPGGSAGENDNAAVTAAYNIVDRLAARTQAAWILIHHSSKGDQSNKSIVDVGAGAGSQARATDCHMVLREHELPDTVVLEAKVRSFPPVKPVVLEWTYPVWRVIDADPTRLKRANSRKDVPTPAEIAAQQSEALAEHERLRTTVLDTIRSEDHSDSSLRRRLTGIIRPAVLSRLLNDLLTDGQLTRVPANKYGKPCDVYRVVTA